MIKKSTVLNLILLLSAVLTCSISFATTITDKDFEKAVLNKLNAEMKKMHFEDYNISVHTLPFTYLNVPDGKIEIRPDALDNKLLASRMVIRTSVYVDNKYIKSVGIPISLTTMKKVYVAKQKISVGETLTKDKIELKKTDITGKQKCFLTNADLEKEVVALKTFQPNEVISSRFVKIQPDITKNSMVKVIINSQNSILITTDAIALSDGRIGDTINVKNPKANKIYSGKIIDDNKILVKM